MKVQNAECSRVFHFLLLTSYFLLIVGCVTTQGKKTNLPTSNQATFIESTSPVEVMIRAAGIGKKAKHAETDARKAAVWFVLFGGTDPLIKAPAEKRNFEVFKEDFFKEKNIMKYITWEAMGYHSRIKMANKRIKIEKDFKINKEFLYNYLVENNIIAAREELAEAIGLPSIMVLPETPKGVNPLGKLADDELARHGATVIEGYLTAREYDVTVPEQQSQLDNIRSAVQGIKGLETDDCYALALSIGSDIYIKYQIKIDKRRLGGRLVRKASVTAKAYETTTADLLGAETGYSKERPSPDAVVAEEGLHDAIDKVLSRVTRYWQKEIKRGHKFKLTFNLVGDFDEDEIEEIQFGIDDVLKEVLNKTKKITVTDKTLDYCIWTKKQEDSMGLYRALKKVYAGPGKLKKTFDTRKFLMFEIR